jgi:hypothetical protein
VLPERKARGGTDGKSEDTVERATKKLRRLGYCTVKQRRNTSALYTFPGLSQEPAPQRVPDREPAPQRPRNPHHSGFGNPHHSGSNLLKNEPTELNLSSSSAPDGAAPPKGRRPARIPEDAIITPEHIAAAALLGIHEQEARTVFDAFKDYHLSKATAFADWNAAWRNWCRKHLEFAAKRGGNGSWRPKRVNPMKTFDDLIDKARAEEGEPRTEVDDCVDDYFDELFGKPEQARPMKNITPPKVER